MQGMASRQSAELNHFISLTWMALAMAACGSQKGEDYLGEPLLSMRGVAKVSALTGGEPIVPALCFLDPAQLEYRERRPLSLEGLPAEIAADFEDQAGSETDNDFIQYIVDVQSNGRFPADFDVDVYLPPPTAALAASGADEPRMAVGVVCAAKQEHRAATHAVQFFRGLNLDRDVAGGGTCFMRDLWLVSSSGRFYAERYECPLDYQGAESQGEEAFRLVETSGDPSLKLEAYAEDVMGVAERPSVVYLESPAAPGSATAFRLGAALTGLSAGYHLFDEYPAPPAQCAPSSQQMLALVAAELGLEEPVVRAKFEQQGLRAFTSEQVARLQQALSRFQQEACPSWSAPARAEAPFAIEIGAKRPSFTGEE